MYQYFIQAVPTEIESLVSSSMGVHGSLKTWQYSVRFQSRQIGHQFGSHGIPGIYFKYLHKTLGNDAIVKHFFLLLLI